MFRKERQVYLLHELLKDWPCTFTGKTFKLPIKGITEHSKRVKPGFLFVARKGAHEDGLAYIEEAIHLGAVAVVVDRQKQFNLKIPVIVVPNSQRFLSYASARLAGNPSERLKVIAVTGTNGKTTVSYFIGQLLRSVGVKAAVLGTLGMWVDGVKKAHKKLPTMTTLPAEYLHPLLAQCEKDGITHIVMEASSLGLSTERLAHCEIDLGLLLNISEDHYEEHGSKEAYLLAKQQLIQVSKKVIVNCDDEKCMALAQVASEKPIYFGENHQADFQLIINGQQTFLKTPTSKQEIHFTLTEDFNRQNILAAISALDVLSYTYEKIEAPTRRLTLPEGRMERIEKKGIIGVVDYAHTPDALEAVLQSLVNVSQRKVIVVFGCGGNRDHGKRKKMGEVAARYASTVIVTSDNPRNEDPLQIIDEIAVGIPKEISFYKEVDRKKAIQQAVTIAQPEDIILVAGKGHESTQQIAGKTYPFSDQEILKQLLNEKQLNKI